MDAKGGYLVKKRCFVALMAVALSGSPALADGPSFTFDGNTSGAPTFDRPRANGNSAPVMLDDGFGKGVAYQAIEFRVSQTGQYTITMTGDFDTYLGLYRSGFDPKNPLENVIVYNDDATPGSLLTSYLGFGTAYIVVATGYDTWDEGAFTLSFYGDGDILLTPPGVGAVPEPASWAMLIAGFGFVGGTLRHRRAVTA